MTWWHRNKGAVEARQVEAEAAVEASKRQLQAVRALEPEVDKRVSMLQRLNRENGFQESMGLAFQGRA